MSKSATTTDRLPPIHPGEVLSAEFMEPYGLSATALARRIGVPPNRITEIVRGGRSITGATAIRLARCFGTTPYFWINLQSRFEIETAEDEAGAALAKIEPIAAA